VVALVNEPACHIKAHPPHAVDSYIHVAPPLLASQHFSISGSWGGGSPPVLGCESLSS
jgi:hypothetical protein